MKTAISQSSASGIFGEKRRSAVSILPESSAEPDPGRQAPGPGAAWGFSRHGGCAAGGRLAILLGGAEVRKVRVPFSPSDPGLVSRIGNLPQNLFRDVGA